MDSSRDQPRKSLQTNRTRIAHICGQNHFVSLSEKDFKQKTVSSWIISIYINNKNPNRGPGAVTRGLAWFTLICCPHRFAQNHQLHLSCFFLQTELYQFHTRRRVRNKQIVQEIIKYHSPRYYVKYKPFIYNLCLGGFDVDAVPFLYKMLIWESEYTSLSS